MGMFYTQRTTGSYIPNYKASCFVAFIFSGFLYIFFLPNTATLYFAVIKILKPNGGILLPLDPTMDLMSKYYLDFHCLQLKPNQRSIPEFPDFLEDMLLQLIISEIILMSIPVSILRCKQQKPTLDS